MQYTSAETDPERARGIQTRGCGFEFELSLSQRAPGCGNGIQTPSWPAAWPRNPGLLNPSLSTFAVAAKDSISLGAAALPGLSETHEAWKVAMFARAVRQQRSFAKAWLSSAARKVEKQELGLFGICEDRNSSFLRGPAQAPELIRKALRCTSTNSCGELEGFEVVGMMKDYEDVVPGTPDSEATAELLRPLLRKMVLQDGRIPLMLGGDHSVTYPMIKVLAELLGEQLTIVHFDAHPDIYPCFEDNPWSHASPFARIMEGKSFCSRLISCGIRTGSSDQRIQLDRFPVTWIEAKNFPEKGRLLPLHAPSSWARRRGHKTASALLCGLTMRLFTGRDLRTMLNGLVNDNTPVYVSVDLDVLEPVRVYLALCICVCFFFQ